ncbi:lipid A export ATP-binding/permease protein MsbA [Algibacter lectus]|uniref:Lipid A export ATP-binding/permease protein MsbA n=1 Tax=Algibacter lectus TaxID=221126 RepID=A0A090WPE6_9FLAO|nr:lipid A export ATP-binding/permease protein MsbA [Algibacter lectus]
MRKDTLIRQHDIKDCGAACLASVAAHYGLKMSLAKIRQLCHTDKKGTNVLGLIQALESMGFNAMGVKGNEDSLHDIPLPAIAHVMINGEIPHYLVIYKVSKNKIFVMDPTKAKIDEYPLEEFNQIWTNVLVLLEPNEYFEQRNDKFNIYSRFWNLVTPA